MLASKCVGAINKEEYNIASVTCAFVCSLYVYNARLRYNWLSTVVGSRFTTGLRSRIFGCKSNRRKNEYCLNGLN